MVVSAVVHTRGSYVGIAHHAGETTSSPGCCITRRRSLVPGTGINRADNFPDVISLRTDIRGIPHSA